jgi:diguanylate cyclase (GGDEF)-like protein
VREISANLCVADVGERLVDAVLRLGGATGAELVLDAREEGGGALQTRGETHGKPARLFDLHTRGERLGQLRVFAIGPLADFALDALVAHGALALANARAHEAALLRADYDSLTGIANFGRLTAALERELAHALRYGRALALVMFDIDDLKGWNDRYGHAAGNTALVRVATLLCERSRQSDTAGRYGGDELVLVLPETTTDGALAVAEKVRAAVESLAHSDGGASLTISAGVASVPADGTTVADLIRAADARLYRAKAAGKNRVIA